jgi:hypothetical protein
MTRTTCKFRCSLHTRTLEGKPGFYVRDSASGIYGIDLNSLHCPEHARWDTTVSDHCKDYWVMETSVDDRQVSLTLVLSSKILTTTIEPNPSN